MQSNTTPTVSTVLPDGTIIETLYDRENTSTCFAVAAPDGVVSRATDYVLQTGERLVPYSADNTLLTTGCVLLASDIVNGESTDTLVRDIGEYLDRYVDLSAGFREIVPYYVLLSWVYDAFSELGMLRLAGDLGSGKTRALLTIGSITYKPFFASGASTVSPIFHLLDSLRGTLILDEADFKWSDLTADLTKLLNNGTVDGLPILRTMPTRTRELNPRAFRVFGPKLIAMRGRFEDDGLESRFITEHTGGRPLPPHIPIHLPRALKGEAALLRNRLLAWRMRNRHSAAPNPDRLMAGVHPRANQTALALLSLVDDPNARARIETYLRGEDRERIRAQLDTDEARVLLATAQAFAQSTTAHVTISSIAHIFNMRILEKSHLPVSNKWVGGILRNRFQIATVKSHGIYVIPHSARERVDELARRYETALRTGNDRSEP